MNYKINLLLIKNKAKLDKMIKDNEPYEKILHQSKIVDRYVVELMKSTINKI